VVSTEATVVAAVKEEPVVAVKEKPAAVVGGAAPVAAGEVRGAHHFGAT